MMAKSSLAVQVESLMNQDVEVLGGDENVFSIDGQPSYHVRRFYKARVQPVDKSDKEKFADSVYLSDKVYLPGNAHVNVVDRLRLNFIDRPIIRMDQLIDENGGIICIVVYLGK